MKYFIFLFLCALQFACGSKILVATSTYDKNFHLIDVGRETWRSGIHTFVLTNGAEERRATERNTHLEEWIEYPDGDQEGNNRAEKRTKALPRLANRTFHGRFEWMLIGEDNTVWHIPNVKIMLRGLDPALPLYIHDGNVMQTEHVNCVMAHDSPVVKLETDADCTAWRAGPNNENVECKYTRGKCVYSPSKDVCTIGALGNAENCNQPVDWLVYSHGDYGSILSAGLLDAISAEDWEACESECHGTCKGADVDFGRCILKLGFGPTRPYGNPNVQVFGGTPLASWIARLEDVANGTACNSACIFSLERGVSTWVPHGESDWQTAQIRKWDSLVEIGEEALHPVM